MSKYVVMQTVTKIIDGKTLVTMEPIMCPGDGSGGHIYPSVMKTGRRKNLPKLYDRCVCGSEYWGTSDDRDYFTALAEGKVTTH